MDANRLQTASSPQASLARSVLAPEGLAEGQPPLACKAKLLWLLLASGSPRAVPSTWSQRGRVRNALPFSWPRQPRLRTLGRGVRAERATSSHHKSPAGAADQTEPPRAEQHRAGLTYRTTSPPQLAWFMTSAGRQASCWVPSPGQGLPSALGLGWQALLPNEQVTAGGARLGVGVTSEAELLLGGR